MRLIFLKPICIYQYPETAFLALFRMHRASFWQLVKISTQAGRRGYWDHRAIESGRSPKPIYYQIAVALYILGGGGGGAGERTRIALNIGYGTVRAYTWRTIELLHTLLSEYIHWLLQSVPRPIESGHSVPRHCIGFIDGSNIVLRDKPMVDPEAYFSRKKNYGFNLQAICNWESRFIWASMAHTASAHDSPAWKSTALYQSIGSYFHPEEYLLADKAMHLRDI